MSYGKLEILHYDQLQNLPVKDDVRWSLTRQGEPGKLTFTVIDTGNYTIEEGDRVTFSWNEKVVFVGFLFSRTTNKEGDYDCIAYDQIRYLKNKDTIMFKEADTQEVFDILAETFGLVVDAGLSTTGHYFTKVEENKSGLDMIGDFCDEVLINKQKMFVMYDDVGIIRFKDIEYEMGLEYLLDENNAEDFSYTISIDDETYNRIKIVSKDGEYLSVIDSDNIYKWGLLQLYQKIDGKPEKLKANAMLDLYNRPSKTIKVNGAFGDIRVRAGCWIPVHIQMKHELINYPLIVEEITHNFKANDYTMDMTLMGGRGFIA